tara:strand:- start:482 stop:910 length:429 start_codon:yes stop_codon:yes gene_type:complete
MLFDPNIWGPHYWFFLHTIAESYPENPNQVTKKKYYDLINNMPLFIPNDDLGDKFSKYLDKYPVSPYLSSRESFVRWMHFIHNKYNVLLNKKEISLPEALSQYRDLYKPKLVHLVEKINLKKHYLYAFFILLLIYLIYLWYE